MGAEIPVSKVQRLGDSRDPQPRRARLEHGLCRSRVAVAVGVSLDDPHDLGPTRDVPKDPDVVPDRTEVDLGPHPVPPVLALGPRQSHRRRL